MKIEFKRHTHKPTTVKHGTVLYGEVIIPVNHEQKRIVRVYLPKDYDGKKRFAVMYMTDGQNMVDRYTSAYGDWEIDKRMAELNKKGYDNYILVGVDCPKNPNNRSSEYTFNNANLAYAVAKYVKNFSPYGDKFAKWIVEELKPYIDEHFLTLSDREHTAFGGSSMGGLFSFDIVTQYPEIFGFSLSFSPAFCCHSVHSYMKEISKRNIETNSFKLFFYTGGLDPLEQRILKGTVEVYLKIKSYKFDDDHLQLMADSRQRHHEYAWSMYFNEAIKMWQKGRKEEE